MDQIKIGRFIAECRKRENLTQMQLAEKLGITDRAISKWENGRAMPDSSIMIELCEILKISVNDLLCGEVVTMENYNKELEKRLLEMVKQKEESDKRLLALEWVVCILSMIVLLVPIYIASYLQMEDWQRIVLCFSGFVPCFIGFFVALKIEQVAGYYECKVCGHRYVPTFKAVNLSMHMGRTRYMKCPRCNKKSWQKKVIGEVKE
ncbi:MAG: helix-turn-helix transcriptional regulator [Ruminococcaceae bacterium]|nr:helix-turn-helix transcriptional regulator [Oscillospiraceae bacterium]